MRIQYSIYLYREHRQYTTLNVALLILTTVQTALMTQFHIHLTILITLNAF